MVSQGNYSVTDSITITTLNPEVWMNDKIVDYAAKIMIQPVQDNMYIYGSYCVSTSYSIPKVSTHVMIVSSLTSTCAPLKEEYSS